MMFIQWIWLKICIFFKMFPILETSMKELYSGFNFQVFKIAKHSKARRGVITTPHGDIQTPAFIFCATKASMKTSTIPEVIENKTQIILSNTYHLFLKGYDVIKRLGGLHQALGFNKPMLTDSGGYQVFAMNFDKVSSDIKGSRTKTFEPTLISVKEKGAKFRSYYTKEIVELTPEKSIQVQMDLGADIILAFDECTSSTISKEDTKKSMELSHRWEKRSIDYFLENGDTSKQAMYGIIQGGTYLDFREASCSFVNNNKFFGHAIGGCLGTTSDEMYKTVNHTMSLLKKDRPVHLLGIGYIKDIFNGVKQGIDTFDCVHPTRIGRHGFALIPKGKLDLSKGKYKTDDTSIMSDCKCTTCQKHTKSYLNLLITSKEKIGYHLITNHNIFFMNKLMEDIRYGIETDTLNEVERKYL